MRIGIMTGGGDAPGLNGIIESASRALLQAGTHELVGIQDGFDGIFDKRIKTIRLDEIIGIHSQAGTFLGTSNKSRIAGRGAEFLARYKELGLDGLIVAGGDGTFAALSDLAADVPVVGVPKTIDNDLSGTEITFGYDTACSVVADAVDALRFTADAHRRVMVVEAMGRTAGWIALGGGLASYADAILIPERPFSRAKLLEFIRGKKASGTRGIVIVASESARAQDEDAVVSFRVEGSHQKERFGGIAEKLARWIESETGWESRHVVLGHLQRSRAPSTTDRFLTASMGVKAAQLVARKQWNQAVVYREGRVLAVPLAEIQGPARLVPADHLWVALAQGLGIFV